MNKTYYLRVEGVNLSNFVYDTQDLNTIRGGGLLLLNSIEELKKKFNCKLEPISTGASSGLFGLNVNNIDEAKCIKKQINDYINQDEKLKHATFVIDILESEKGDEESKKSKEMLIALNHWNQMQSPSVAVPSQTSCKPCEIDMVRPASYKTKKGDEELYVSESVHNRREYGKEAKQKFYENLTGNKGYKFVDEFREIAEDKSKGNLNNKMAVIYIDGNDFGKIQANIGTKEELEKWDETIKNYRKDFLSELLREANSNDDWKNDGKIRLETLLWGGDEIMFVVPAWLGWWTLDFFYQRSKCWSFNDRLLKHAGGIVFCHYDAPIHRITSLSKSLAELAKEKCRGRNLFAYQKLESFDHIGTKSVKDYLNDTYGEKIDFVLDGEKMSEISDKIKELKVNEFSKSCLYEIVQHLVTNKAEPDDGFIEKLAKKAIRKDGSLKGALENLDNLFNCSYAKWIHIAELWDYIV